MVLRFDGSVTISEAQVYLGGKEKRHFVCSVPNAEGDGWDAIGEETELLSVYCWNPVEIHYRTYELGIVSMDESAEVLEIVLLDPDGNPILPSNADDYPEAFDEQELFPADTTYEYQSMFDEVYHARTANEIVEGRTVYETTHPPLGKWWMSLGIRVFGMTPFGWRCVCALFGILMVPVSYAFMRKISRSTWIASFAALLIVFDFMHFTLSRIGTIDVIVGFFILLTFYLMYLVLDDLKMGCSWKTVCLMILNGMAAGAAMASKWTGYMPARGLQSSFYIFVPGIWDSCGTDQKGNVWTGGDKLPGGAVCHLYRCIHFDSGSDLRCILSFLWKWYGKWKCFPDYVGKSAAYASLPRGNGV